MKENNVKIIDSFHGEYAFLSNYYDSPIFYDGILYPTVEHAFQAAKTTVFIQRIIIANKKTPGQAKCAGRKVTLRDNWVHLGGSADLQQGQSVVIVVLGQAQLLLQQGQVRAAVVGHRAVIALLGTVGRGLGILQAQAGALVIKASLKS